MYYILTQYNQKYVNYNNIRTKNRHELVDSLFLPSKRTQKKQIINRLKNE